MRLARCLGPVGRFFQGRTLRDEAIGVKHPALSIDGRQAAVIAILAR